MYIYVVSLLYYLRLLKTDRVSVALAKFVIIVTFLVNFDLSVAKAESLKQALATAYSTNPTIEAQRAGLRSTDENVSQALGGYRPTITATGDAGYTYQDIRSAGTGSNSDFNPRGIAITVSQPIFQGFTVVNSVKQAEALVLSGREALRNQEQNTLFDGVQAYMDVVRDLAIVKLRRNNKRVLAQQLKATRDRFEVGETTRTDVAQAEARLSGTESDLSLALSNLETSKAVYEQIIGNPPGKVTVPRSIESKLPRSLDQAVATGNFEHPAIKSAIYNEQAAKYQVKVNKGNLLPTVTVDGSYSKRWESSSNINRSDDFSVTGRLNVPIYQRGQVSSSIRQAKDNQVQSFIQIQEARRQVKAAVVSAWGQHQAIKSQIKSSQTQVRANVIALQGVREEAKVGQRTLLDVLDAEQELLDSQVELATIERDRIVASYAVLSAVGRLSARTLALPVRLYDPSIHYNQIRNKWFSLHLPGLD